MTKDQQYESANRELAQKALTPQEYEQAIIVLTKRLGP